MRFLGLIYPNGKYRIVKANSNLDTIENYSIGTVDDTSLPVMVIELTTRKPLGEKEWKE
jgi:hypothetical protein